MIVNWPAVLGSHGLNWLLKIASIGLASCSTIFGVILAIRGADGKLTRWGYCALFGGVLGAGLTLLLYVDDANTARKAAKIGECIAMRQTLQLRDIAESANRTLVESNFIVRRQQAEIEETRNVANQQTLWANKLQRLSWDEAHRVDVSDLTARVIIRFDGEPIDNLPIFIREGVLKLSIAPRSIKEGVNTTPVAFNASEQTSVANVQSSGEGVRETYPLEENNVTVESARFGSFEGALGPMTKSSAWQGATVHATLSAKVLSSISKETTFFAKPDTGTGEDRIRRSLGSIGLMATRTGAEARLILFRKGTLIGESRAWLVRRDPECCSSSFSAVFPETQTTGVANPYGAIPVAINRGGGENVPFASNVNDELQRIGYTGRAIADCRKLLAREGR